MTDVAAINNAYNKVLGGKGANEDAWMVTWTRMNFADLLQPAPLSIALLGSLCVLASSTQDFSLVVKPVEGYPASKIEWKVVKHPHSFKTCLQQLIQAGTTAYETAQASMTDIMNSSSTMPNNIQMAVKWVVQGTQDQMKAQVPNYIKLVINGSEVCAKAATDVEEAFKYLVDLTDELTLASTHKYGSDEQVLEANKVHFAVLEQQKEGEEAILKMREDTEKMMKKSFTEAQEDFREAMRDIPKGWEIVGMSAVESLVGLVVSAGNAAVSAYTMKAQVAQAGIGAFSNKSPDKASDIKAPTGSRPDSSNKEGVSTQPSVDALSDPAIIMVPMTMMYARTLDMLLTGGPKNTPDWDKIREKGGAQWLKKSLEVQKARLDLSKDISKKLDPLISSSTTMAAHILDVANSVAADRDSILQKHQEPVKKLVADVEGLWATCSFVLNQTGAPSLAVATPQAPSATETSTSAAKLAVDTAKYKADLSRQALNSARESYEKATESLIKSKEQLTKTMAEITKVTCSNASLEQILPILREAVQTFTLLRAQFGKIAQFFRDFRSLMVQVMKPEINLWADTLTTSQETMAGVTPDLFERQMIYSQMMVPMKVCMLATKISTTYLKVSNDYIMPSQRQLGTMLQFAEKPTAESREELMTSLRQSLTALEKQANKAATGIVEVVQADQRTFSDAINNRILELTEGLTGVVPGISMDEKLPPRIREVGTTYVKETTTSREVIQSKVNNLF